MSTAARVSVPPPVADVRRAAQAVSAHALATALIALFAFDNLLLPAFLGAPVAAMALAAVPVAALLGWLLARAGMLSDRVPLATLGTCLAAALALFLLGGEGGVFYANPDWQVRGAVLADMAHNPWPYAYDIGGWKALLRAPLGLYLLPALAPGWSDAAMLVSNSVRLGLMLALAATLFDSRRTRIAALGVFAVFSGWDVIGNALMSALEGPQPWDHLEQWNPGSQYSATVTLAFWVPNHAIAGWACALAYLMWLRGKAPVGLLAATIPLAALWSPLAAFGALPFAAHAAVRVLRTRECTRYDLALGLAGTAIALPALWYLRLDADAVGLRWWPLQLVPLVLLLLLEVAPFAVPLLRLKRLREGDRTMLWIAVYCLLFMPFVRVGVGIDFQMRASIVPLALLTFAFAEWLGDLTGDRSRRMHLVGALAVLAIGAATPAFEMRRALVNGPSPAPLCSLAGAWQAQTNAVPPYATYLAGADTLPGWLAAAPVTAGRADPPRCWARPWVPVNAR